jgi:hypothetical protein
VHKPFTVIAALLLGLVAAAQTARAYFGIEVVVDGYQVPIAASWIAAGVAAFLSVMLFREAA